MSLCRDMPGRGPVAIMLGFATAVSLTTAAGAVELSIDNVRGESVTVEVELAQDEHARAQGYQGRAEVPRGHGMWFDFGRPVAATMWMKDTPVALDMVFVDARGAVVAVVTGTEPNSTRLIPAPEPVRYVLEVAAGEAARLGVAAGAHCALRALPAMPESGPRGAMPSAR